MHVCVCVCDWCTTLKINDPLGAQKHNQPTNQSPNQVLTATRKQLEKTKKQKEGAGATAAGGAGAAPRARL